MFKKIIKLSMIGVFIISLSGLITFNAGCKRELKNYNIVVILIDTLRSDRLDAYGYEKVTAPFLTELSKKSMLFENCFAASSWTAPSTASIFTSLYPFQHSVLMGLLAQVNAKKEYPDLKINRIPDEIETMPEVFKNAGYSTFAISDNDNICEKQGFHQGFDKMIHNSYKGGEKMNAELFSWKEEIQNSKKYFLYLHYMDPHAPYHARKPWYKKPDNRKRVPLVAYESEISYVDSLIKKAYDAFGWDKNTVIVITADHGEGLWDHGRQGHGHSLYREEIQVPLIIHVPDNFNGIKVRENVTSLDILPTLRDTIGLPKSDIDEGLSLLPLAGGNIDDFKDRYIYSHLWKKVKFLVEAKATIQNNFHFQHRTSKKKEVFNLKVDKKEEKNIYFKVFKIAKVMERMFEKFYSESRKFKKNIVNYKMNKKRMEKLKTLGYVQE